jgi:hypothetical protein
MNWSRSTVTPRLITMSKAAVMTDMPGGMVVAGYNLFSFSFLMLLGFICCAIGH